MTFLGVHCAWLLGVLVSPVVLVESLGAAGVCSQGERWAEADYGTDCRAWYFTCRDGELIKSQCQSGEEFNPDTGFCEEGFKSHCLYPKAMTDCVTGVIWTRPDPSDCASSYYKCHDGEVDRIECPEGSQFSEINQTCIQGYTSPCNRPVEARDCVKGVLWTKPNHNDCRTKYYRCVNGKFQSRVCKKGAQYSMKEGKCIAGHLSNCEPAPRRKDCLPDQEWIIPDMLNCALRYFECNHGVFKTVSCEPEYEFDPMEGKCMLGYSSDCDKQKTSNATTESESLTNALDIPEE